MTNASHTSTQDPVDDRLNAAVRADTQAQFDSAKDRIATVLAAADGSDATKGIHRITEDTVFDDIWGRRFPTGRDQWIYLDANAARAIARHVVTAAIERAADR